MRRLPKPHIGYEEFVEPFAEMMSRFDGYIAKNGIDVEGMRTSVRDTQSLASTREAAAQYLALVRHTRFLEESNGWKQLLLIYGRARAAAKTNPDIALASFEQFMKQGPHKKKAPAPTK